MIAATSMTEISDTPKSDDGFQRWLRRLVPPLVVGAFVLALIAEPPAPDIDLMLLAPDQAMPGATVPLRALALAGLREEAGPTNALHRPIEVALRGADGRVLARTQLVDGVADSLEGEITLPVAASGQLSLVATMSAGLDGEPAVVERFLQISERAEPAQRVGRLGTPAQRYRPQSVVRVAGETPPRDLDLRALGGACAPELPCELRVWVGEPAAQIRIASTPTMEVRPAEASALSAGFVAFTAVVRSAEAVAHVEASREGRPIATRAVRLSVLMAGHALLLPDGPIAQAPARPSLEVRSLSDGRSFVVDAYRDGHWLHSASVSLDGSYRAPLPFELPPGLWRLQVHADPFSSMLAAGRLVLVLAPGADALATLRDVAGRRDMSASSDPLGNLLVSGQAPPGTPREVAEQLLALPELDFRPLPEIGHGILQIGPDQNSGRRVLRTVAASLVLLAGLVIAWLLLRRGKAAGRQADTLRHAADEAVEAATEHEGGSVDYGSSGPLTSSGGLYAAAFFVICAFAVTALLVVSRGCVS